MRAVCIPRLNVVIICGVSSNQKKLLFTLPEPNQPDDQEAKRHIDELCSSIKLSHVEVEGSFEHCVDGEEWGDNVGGFQWNFEASHGAGGDGDDCKCVPRRS
ncbi:hypothetical protein EJ110_NYTH07337 [Nymphaea thermarum]|nr:hypothetical protein EJ110_NYTH07337 [Nymphaea thermarum]